MSSFHGNAAAGADNNNNSNKENTPDLLPDPRKATPFMLKSLGQLHDTLLCPLCHKMMREPSTLACAHTFCLQCIKDYSCNQSICPVKGCGIPLSVTGSRKGSFLKTNPSIETVVTSLQTICQTLDKAPAVWWKHADDDVKRVSDNKKMGVEQTKTIPKNNNGDNNSDNESHDEDKMDIMPPSKIMPNASLSLKKDEECGSEKQKGTNWLRQHDSDSDDDE